MAVTRNLKLRLSNELTADARYNLERIDQLGTVFPIDSSATQRINSASDIYLNANSTSLGGDGNGTVFAPNLQLQEQIVFETGQYSFTLRAATQTSNLSFTLPPDAGTSGQFLSTNGVGTLTWSDPPTSTFETLNDTSFSDLENGDIPQYDAGLGRWVNASIPVNRQTGVFDWLTIDGSTKTIVHGFGTTDLTIQIRETLSGSPVWTKLDYLDNDTILLTAKRSPELDYKVHIIQTV